MSRVKINFPEVKPLITTILPVRISDINYGGHVGNDAVLSIIHEARMRLLALGKYTEMDIGGCGLIMADVMIAYKGEAFYGDVLTIRVYVAEVGNSSFDLLYQITTIKDNVVCDIAHAKTAMVCFNYELRKTVGIPESFRKFLSPDN